MIDIIHFFTGTRLTQIAQPLGIKEYVYFKKSFALIIGKARQVMSSPDANWSMLELICQNPKLDFTPLASITSFLTRLWHKLSLILALSTISWS